MYVLCVRRAPSASFMAIVIRPSPRSMPIVCSTNGFRRFPIGIALARYGRRQYQARWQGGMPIRAKFTQMSLAALLLRSGSFIRPVMPGQEEVPADHILIHGGRMLLLQ